MSKAHRSGARIAVAAALAVASPVASPPGATGATGAPLPEDLVVGFSPQTDAAGRRRALAALGLHLVRAVRNLDLVRVRSTGATPSRAAVLAHPAVASVDDLGWFRSAAASTTPAPDDPGFAKQWNLPLIQIPEAWSVSRGEGAVVAVLDTGVAFEDFGPYKRAPDLAGTRFVPGRDLVDGDDHPNDDIDQAAADRPAHGTHSAGIIAQTTGNGQGGAGVAPGAAIMPVRVLGSTGAGSDDQIAAGLMFAADHGAQVVNMSFDSGFDGPMTRAAVAYAAAKGVTMVAAVGNSGRGRIGYPAAYPEVIAVGAVRFDRTRPPYSSFGAPGDVDLVAPGGDLSVDQNGDGEPDGILGQSMVYATNSFGDQAVQGTSAAAPHVSGVAALLVGSGLATTAAEVRRALEASALDVGPPGADAFTGAGLVQARSALTAAGAPPAPAAAVRAPAEPGAGSASGSGSRVPAVLGAVAAGLLLTGAGVAAARRRRPPRPGGSPTVTPHDDEG